MRQRTSDIVLKLVRVLQTVSLNEPVIYKRLQNAELASYQDAVWSYLLEHCDLTEDGALFVKFHTSDRATFEKRYTSALEVWLPPGRPSREKSDPSRTTVPTCTEEMQAKERYLRNCLRGQQILNQSRPAAP
jgi:hypothetical protein